MSTFDDLLAAPDSVKREMRRLRELHGILERALQRSVRERLGSRVTEKRVLAEAERHMREATIELATA